MLERENLELTRGASDPANWRAASGVTPAMAALAAEDQTTIRTALAAYFDAAVSRDASRWPGLYAMRMRMPGAIEPIPQEGKFLHIYARQHGGTWLLARDIWNANARPPGGP
jgi:hypothetical protein